jgi:hypothetical protein
MTELSIRTNNRISTGSISFSDTVFGGDLVANTAVSGIVPPGADFIIFSCTGDFFVSYGGATAAIPTGSPTQGNIVSELNPSVRNVVAGEGISIIAPSDCKITVAFYTK